MKADRHLFTAFFLIAVLQTTAQKKDSILLQSGWMPAIPNISNASIENFNRTARREKSKAFVVLQFEVLPNEAVKKSLAARGIVLLDYLPRNAYTATVAGFMNTMDLRNARVRSLIQLAPEQKLHPSLRAPQLPAWSVRQQGTVDVMILVPKSFSIAEVSATLEEKNISLISDELKSYQVLSIRLSTNRLAELAAYPFVTYVQPVEPDAQPLNFNNRWASGAITVNMSTALGGKGLNGEGVVLGIGDNADVQLHADFTGRLINRSPAPHEGHGTMVTGIAAGAGIINEQLRGYASKATIVSQYFNGILTNAPLYVKDHHMVITNNSYSTSAANCESFGTYNISSYIIDQQAFDLPHLQHVFAAGNSGNAVCGGYTPGYGSVLGACQAAKNVITVGASNHFTDLWPKSSKGPVKDGRLKPEITAMGSAVLSTYPTNAYAYDFGTSLAAPAVSGGLALLYQRYRQLNGGADPKSGLMKTLLCAAAADRGNAGPDYAFGFGFMNIKRSIELLENGNYAIGQVASGETKTHTFTVPANTALVKATLYWHDPPASLLSAQALVNDLDLVVTDPSSQPNFPRVLNAAPMSVTDVAVNGVDRTNNMEQVWIEQAAAGTYTMEVTGSRVAQNPSQEYYIVYDIVPADIVLKFPVGNHNLVPGEVVTIAWDAFAGGNNTFTVQWSADNGATWTDLSTAVPAAERYLDWTVPAVVSENVRVRVLRNTTALSSTSQPFAIIGVPAISLSTTQCEGYIKLDWSAVPGVTDYEVMMLRGDEMTPMATTTLLTHTFSSLSKDSTYWVSVRARLNGNPGRRANALSRRPNNGTCGGSISNNDLKLSAVLAPVPGRKFTKTELKNAPVTISVKNLDDAAANNFTVGYSVNGGAWITEMVATAIAAGGVYTHSFATPYDFSSTGNYTIRAVVTNSTADAITGNDTVTVTVKHLSNQLIDLSSTFTDDFETAATRDYLATTTGIDGIDRYDFEKTDDFGRLRTFVNSDFAHSGTRAITIDRRQFGPRSTSYLMGTYNLQGYDAATEDLRLDFLFRFHGNNHNLDNRVWIRGADTLPWIPVYDLYSESKAINVFNPSGSIEVADSLQKYGQQFSSSFQVRWSQSGFTQATGLNTSAGFTFEDIRLYKALNDLRVVQVDTPQVVACGQSAVTPVRVSFRNNSHLALNNIPVRYAVNNVWVSETIPSIPGNTTVSYTFNATANFSNEGIYQLTAVVSYPADNYRTNDTLKVPVRVLPLIASFPHIQDFENGTGGWYAEGLQNSSWGFGTPAAPKINRAASGQFAWKTNLQGAYNDMERSVLSSPCYRLSGMDSPMLSFSFAYDLEDCGAVLCDGSWIEYTTDEKTWTRLAGGTFTPYDVNNQYWSRENKTRWRVASIPLPKNADRFRFRFVMFSDEAVNREGLAIDDIHIYDFRAGIYDSATVALPAKAVSGAGWSHLESDGKLVASVLPNGQDLGTTASAVHIFRDSTRFFNNQYYHGRNLVIQPASVKPADSVTVRFYFTDKEVESIANAVNCSGCPAIPNAYALGVIKYNDINNEVENGTIADNVNGSWSFIPRADLSVVPFDIGYYAEFKVNSFSEFWLAANSFGIDIPHAVQLLDFAAGKQGNDAVLSWTITGELNVDHYEVQHAVGNAAMQQGVFNRVGTVPALNQAGQRVYGFTDAAPGKAGVRYYRLKIVYKDGSFTYSEMRPVVFSDEMEWIVFPNPSDGLFYLSYQQNEGTKISARLLDATGRLMRSFEWVANGFVQKVPVDLTAHHSGVYLLQLNDGSKTRLYKLFRK